MRFRSRITICLALLSIVLPGCKATEERATVASASVAGCTEFLKHRLRSPSTLSIVKRSTFQHTLDKDTGVFFLSAAESKSALGNRENLPITVATIEYDAANVFETPVRSTEMCAFSTKLLEEEKDPRFFAKMIALTRAEQFHLAQAREPGTRLPLYPCCVSSIDWQAISGVPNYEDIGS